LGQDLPGSTSYFMRKRSEHSPQYPPFIEYKPTWRGLAFYENNQLVTELQTPLTIASYAQFKEAWFDLQLLVFVPSLPEFVYFDDIIREYPNSQVMANPKENQAINARVKQGRQTRWIVQANRWPLTSHGMPFLEEMREAYKHCGVGTPPTPAGLGQALMRESWREQYPHGEWKAHRHSVPSLDCCRFIREHQTGGRVDTPGLGQYYDKLLELDLSNAYAAHYGRHPTGTACILYERGKWPHDYDQGTWFCECEVTIHKQLALGPFPVRRQHGNEEKVTYPTQVGTYTAFLWKEQAEDARRLGCTVRVQSGYGWNEFTSDNQAFVELVDFLLYTSPSPMVRSVVKSATVAGIGRHGMDDTLHILVPEEYATDGDMRVNSPHSATALNYFVHAQKLPRQANMVHWYSYTMMQCARTLFQYAYPYAAKEWLVATNYDAVYLSTWGDEMTRYRPKTANDRRTGELNYILHDSKMWVKAPRTIKKVE
jgi:hypothetical protein